MLSPGTHPGLEGAKHGFFFRSKSGYYGGLVPGLGIHLETILCAIPYPNTLDSIQAPIQGWRGPKMAFFLRSKPGFYGGLVLRLGTDLETILCAISHPNTWDSMTYGLFCPLQASIQSLEGTRLLWRASSRVGNSPGNYIIWDQRVQDMANFWVLSKLLWRAGPTLQSPFENCILPPPGIYLERRRT